MIPFLKPPDLGFLALGIADANLAVAFANIIEELFFFIFRDVALGNDSLMRDTKISLQFRNNIWQEAVNAFIDLLNLAKLLLNARRFHAYHWLLGSVLLIYDCPNGL